MHKTLHDFLEQTKFANLSPSDSEKGLPQPEQQSAVPDGDLVELPAPDSIDVPLVSFREVMESRRSRRTFSDSNLNLEQLTWLLWATQGVQKTLPESTLRMVPSAGSRHPLDTYLVIDRIEGIRPGLYKYLPLSHQLTLVREDTAIAAKLNDACRRKWVGKAPLVFIWAAVPDRATWKYSERAWRYLFIEAGHSCQNLYLACELIGAACCGVEAFDDDVMNQFLGLDGDKSFALYLAPVGLR